MLPTRVTALTLVAVALFVIPKRGGAQIPKGTPKRATGTAVYPARPSHLRLAPHQRIGLRAASPASTVSESEPNDTVSQADPVALGDTATGTIDPAGDVDFYGIDLTAGTTIEVDLLASLFGSSLDPTMALYGTDSTTLLAFNDDFFDIDSHIEYTVGTTGRYFVAVASFDGSGAPGYTYSLSFGVPGPGDLTTLYATGLGSPYEMAAGPNGEL